MLVWIGAIVKGRSRALWYWRKRLVLTAIVSVVVAVAVAVTVATSRVAGIVAHLTVFGLSLWVSKSRAASRGSRAIARVLNFEYGIDQVQVLL